MLLRNDCLEKKNETNSSDIEMERLNLRRKVKIGVKLTKMIEMKVEEMCWNSCEKIAEIYAAVPVK